MVCYIIESDKCQLLSTNIGDIVDNTVFVCVEESVDNILDISLKKTDEIQQLVGTPPGTLNTIQKLVKHITND